MCVCVCVCVRTCVRVFVCLFVCVSACVCMLFVCVYTFQLILVYSDPDYYCINFQVKSTVQFL